MLGFYMSVFWWHWNSYPYWVVEVVTVNGGGGVLKDWEMGGGGGRVIFERADVTFRLLIDLLSLSLSLLLLSSAISFSSLPLRIFFVYFIFFPFFFILLSCGGVGCRRVIVLCIHV